MAPAWFVIQGSYLPDHEVEPGTTLLHQIAVRCQETRESKRIIHMILIGSYALTHFFTIPLGKMYLIHFQVFEWLYGEFWYCETKELCRLF